MSIFTVSTIECDNCDDIIAEDVDLEYEDASDVVTNHCGGYDVEIGGTWYAHMCESCFDETTYCSWCEDGSNAWRDNSRYCGDYTILDDHEECLEAHHEQLYEDYPDMRDSDGECSECCWEPPTPAKDMYHKPLVTL